MKNNFLEIVGKGSVTFRNILVFAINKLFINRIVHVVP